MKQLQPSTMCDHRRPYVLMRQAPTDRPPFTQKTDRPVRGYTSHEMHPPRCDRQPRRQAAGLALAQADVPNPALRLRWGQPVQARWPIRLVVPVQKHILLLHHLTEGAKVIAFPELLRPQSIDPFHHRVALRFTYRQKDHFNPQVQTQPKRNAVVERINGLWAQQF